MRKVHQTTSVFLCLLVALGLGGCGKESAEQTSVPVETTVTMATTMPEETTVSMETAVPEETVPSTESAATTGTTIPEAEVPYLQKVTCPDQSIYSGPGYDYGFAGTVRAAGTYTILEEVWDEEGNLWGRLKSGAGWIDLTQVRDRIDNPPVITANYADQTLLDSGAYHHYVKDHSEYAVRVAFRVTETIKDISIYSVEYPEGAEQLVELYYMPELSAEKPLVAELDFPGDMSSYTICFTDSRGTVRVYHIYISGRNGELVITES